MEKIRVLCATAKNEIGKNIIDDFLKLLLEINVKIEKQERKYLEDYNYTTYFFYSSIDNLQLPTKSWEISRYHTPKVGELHYSPTK